jgi:putative flippase GtrA
MVLKNKLFLQVMRFCTIGTLAASVNFGIVLALVESNLLSPLTANIIAFFFAFQISYFGHRLWTFNQTQTQHQIAAPRLLLVAGTAFIANEGLFYLLLSNFHLPYPIALLLVLTILPVATFTASKFWVFR